MLQFICGASTPDLCERPDLRALMGDVAEDAVMIGNDVTVERGEPALGEVERAGDAPHARQAAGVGGWGWRCTARSPARMAATYG